jgi:hypothetical protein
MKFIRSFSRSIKFVSTSLHRTDNLLLLVFMVITPWNTLAYTLSPSNKEAQVLEQDYTKLALRVFLCAP